MKTIYIDVGKDDEYIMSIGSILLDKKLIANDIDHYHEEFDDDGHLGNS